MRLLVNIDVDDLERGIRFYTQGLGLTVARRLGAGIVELDGAGAPMYLLAKPAGTRPYAGALVARSYERHWTPVHLDFVVGDVVSARARALAAGATGEGDIEEHVWGKIAYHADPFGNGFCLVELGDRGYDAIAT